MVVLVRQFGVIFVHSLRNSRSIFNSLKLFAVRCYLRIKYIFLMDRWVRSVHLLILEISSLMNQSRTAWVKLHEKSGLTIYYCLHTGHHHTIQLRWALGQLFPYFSKSGHLNLDGNLNPGGMRKSLKLALPTESIPLSPKLSFKLINLIFGFYVNFY